MWWLKRLSFIAVLVIIAAVPPLLSANDTATGYNVKSVQHSGGSFEFENGIWVEKDLNGRANFRFDERQRDDWSVYLYDPSRDVKLQLDLHRKEIFYSTGNNSMTPLYRITGAGTNVAQAPSAPVAASANGRNVVSVSHPGGTFMFRDGLWLEADTAGRVNFRFEEQQRDDWSVYLYDRSRDVNLQLDLHRKQILYSTGQNPLTPLYQITGAAAALGAVAGTSAVNDGSGGSVPAVGAPTLSITNSSGEAILVLQDQNGSQTMLQQLAAGQAVSGSFPPGTVLAFANAAGTAFVGDRYTVIGTGQQSISIPYSARSSGGNPPAANLSVVNVSNNSGQTILILQDQNGSQVQLQSLGSGQAVALQLPAGSVLAFANQTGSAFVGDNFTIKGGSANSVSVPHTAPGSGGTVVSQGGGAVQPPRPQGDVTAHQHCNYGGYSVTIPEGRHSIGALQTFGVRNDDVSSLRVPQGWEVTIYSDAGFKGNSRKLVSNSNCLVDAGMNDVISSIIVERRGAVRTPSGGGTSGSGTVKNDLVLTQAQIKKVADTLIATIVKTQVDAQNRPLACWRDSYGRGVGKIPDCGPGQEKDGLLCYDKCSAHSSARSNATYDNVGGVCWQNCPSGFRNDGAFCRKDRTEYWVGDKGFPWKFGDGLNDSAMFKRCEGKYGRGKCEKHGAIVYPKCDPGYTSVALFCKLKDTGCRAAGMDGGGALTFGSCRKHSFVTWPVTGGCSPEPGTGKARENDAGLCYPKCNARYSGVGPVCWSSCPAHMPVNCGASCAKDQAACTMTLTDQIMSPVMAAGNMAITVGTLGTGTAAVQAGKVAATGAKVAAKVAAKSAARASAKAALKVTVKRTLQAKIKTATKELAKDLAVDAAIGGVITTGMWGGMTLKGKADAKSQINDAVRQQLNEYFSDPKSIDAITEAVIKGVEEQQPDAEFPWESLDPTGVAEIVVAYNLPMCSDVKR